MSMNDLTLLIQSGKEPLDYHTAKRLLSSAVAELRFRSNQDCFGYDSSRAQELEALIDLLNSPALEIYSALGCGDLSRRLWAGRVYARSSEGVTEMVERFLRSPQVNEHMANVWSSAARSAELIEWDNAEAASPKTSSLPRVSAQSSE